MEKLNRVGADALKAGPQMGPETIQTLVEELGDKVTVSIAEQSCFEKFNFRVPIHLSFDKFEFRNLPFDLAV